MSLIQTQFAWNQRAYFINRSGNASAFVGCIFARQARRSPNTYYKQKKIQPIRGKSFHPSQRQNQNTLLLIFSNGETWFDFLIKKAKVHLK